MSDRGDSIDAAPGTGETQRSGLGRWAGPNPIDRHPTPHYISGRAGQAPRVIVIHTTEGSFESAINWFADPASKVSAHYLVGFDGRIVQFVDESDTARHAGRVDRPTAPLIASPNPNLYTIGIEFEDGGDPDRVRRPDAQYRAGARLIAEVAARWEIPLDRRHVIGHRELFAAKRCPGNLDLGRLVTEARGQPGCSAADDRQERS